MAVRRFRTMAVATLLAGLVVLAPSGPSGADGNEAAGAPTVFRSITGGTDFVCGILTTGAVKCWGDNDRGQLGLGDDADRLAPPLTPVDLGSGRTATALTAGTDFVC